MVIGCGDVELLKRLAEAVGPEGELVAVDTDWAVLDSVSSQLGLPQLKTHYSRLVERIVHLPSNSFDHVYVVHRLEGVEQKKAMLTEVERLLKMGGKAQIMVRLKGLLGGGGMKEGELEKLLESPALKLLSRVRVGRSIVLTMERVRPPR